MVEDEFFPVKVKGEATAKYEHTNIKKHLILEIRNDDFEICKPKTIRDKEHWYSKEKIWLVHYKDKEKPDIQLLNP